MFLYGEFLRASIISATLLNLSIPVIESTCTLLPVAKSFISGLAVNLNSGLGTALPIH